jgi:hypothetical protein
MDKLPRGRQLGANLDTVTRDALQTITDKVSRLILVMLAQFGKWEVRDGIPQGWIIETDVDQVRSDSLIDKSPRDRDSGNTGADHNDLNAIHREPPETPRPICQRTAFKSNGSNEINPAKIMTITANAGPLQMGSKHPYRSQSVSARANFLNSSSVGRSASRSIVMYLGIQFRGTQVCYYAAAFAGRISLVPRSIAMNLIQF